MKFYYNYFTIAFSFIVMGLIFSCTQKELKRELVGVEFVTLSLENDNGVIEYPTSDSVYSDATRVIHIPIKVEFSEYVPRKFNFNVEADEDSVMKLIANEKLANAVPLSKDDYNIPRNIEVPFGKSEITFNIEVDYSIVKENYGKNLALLLRIKDPTKGNKISTDDNTAVLLINTAKLFKRRKTLLVNIQGAKGSVLKNASTPNIIQLARQGLYSWDAVADSFASDRTGWASIFSGVSSIDNGVERESYRNNNFHTFPTFISRLKEYNNDFRVMNISNSTTVNDTLIKPQETVLSLDLSRDQLVKDSVVERLSSDNPDLIIATFGSVNEAGIQGGFSTSSMIYTQAIHEVDNYIGEIINALKARETYNDDEEWLVIITSNHGGSEDGSYGGGSFDDRNTFAVYWNSTLSPMELKMPDINIPYDGVYPFFFDPDPTLDYVDKVCGYSYDPALQFGSNEDFTIEFNVKYDLDNMPPSHWYSVVSNKDFTSGGSTGYVIYLRGGTVQLNFTGDDKDRFDMSTVAVDDGEWHHITWVFDRQGSIEVYDNGILYEEGPSIEGAGNLDIGYPFVIGADGTGAKYPTYAFLGDVRVWNSVLKPDVIKDWAFREISPDHPSYASLVGYWKLHDNQPGTDVFKDSGPLNIDLDIQKSDDLVWKEVNKVLNPSDVNKFKEVPNNVDVSPNILFWMGVDRNLFEDQLKGKIYFE